MKPVELSRIGLCDHSCDSAQLNWAKIQNVQNLLLAPAELSRVELDLITGSFESGRVAWSRLYVL
jgi:hypothetical protein